jgi:hypothetical protein
VGEGVEPPLDLASAVQQVIVPGGEAKAARVVHAATALDDRRLQAFLELFAARVRSSADAITPDELEAILAMAAGGAAAPPPA